MSGVLNKTPCCVQLLSGCVLNIVRVAFQKMVQIKRCRWIIMQSFVSINVGFIWHIMCSSSVKWSRNSKGSVLVFSVVPYDVKVDQFLKSSPSFLTQHLYRPDEILYSVLLILASKYHFMMVTNLFCSLTCFSPADYFFFPIHPSSFKPSVHPSSFHPSFHWAACRLGDGKYKTGQFVDGRPVKPLQPKFRYKLLCCAAPPTTNRRLIPLAWLICNYAFNTSGLYGHAEAYMVFKAQCNNLPSNLQHFNAHKL